MIFGFKTKRQRLLELTKESTREADIFVGSDREKIGEEIILWMNRCENKDVNSLKDIGKEAMEERQSEITVMGENNPNWVRACIVESYVSAKILGKPKSGVDEVILQIVSWIEMNAPKAYKKHFNNRSIDSFLE